MSIDKNMATRTTGSPHTRNPSEHEVHNLMVKWHVCSSTLSATVFSHIPVTRRRSLFIAVGGKPTNQLHSQSKQMTQPKLLAISWFCEPGVKRDTTQSKGSYIPTKEFRVLPSALPGLLVCELNKLVFNPYVGWGRSTNGERNKGLPKPIKQKEKRKFRDIHVIKQLNNVDI
jgi:hypothetical protein